MDARIDREERQKEAQAQKEADDKKKQQDEKNREEEEKREAAHKAYLEDLERKYQENLKHIREQAEKEMREADQQAAQKLADQEKRKDLDLRESKLRMDRNKKNLLFLRQELDGQMALKDWYYQLDLAAAGDNALKKREIEVKHNEEMAQLSEQRKAISKAEAEAKAADLDTLGNALNSISDLIGKQTVVGKGLAIATSLINTYQGATKALAQGGMFGFIGAAGVIAAGIASVQKIISTQIPGQASGGGSAGATASTSAPLQPKPQVGTTQLDQQSINGIGNAASGRTFVVDKDIQNNRERAERLNRAARIG
jgi:flagellar biosynthesis GTPase FlhF